MGRAAFFALMAAVATIVAPPPARALSPGAKTLVYYETQANGLFTKRSLKPVDVIDYLIPLSELVKDIAERTPPQILNSLLVEKNGVTYVRWILNPEDTEFHVKVENYLSKKKIPWEKEIRFKGYQTSSRSYIIEDPVTGAEFSVKASTDRTGGLWKYKEQVVSDALNIRRIADFIFRKSKKWPAKNFVVFDEPVMFGLKGVNQAMVVRDISPVTKGDFTYMPAFAALHPAFGARFAEKNGSTEPAEYWREHYASATGRAVAELAAHYGLTPGSPHSQNFLIEFDRNMKPTGRIAFRDMGDSFVFVPYFMSEGEMGVITHWFKPYLNAKLDVRFQPTHGTFGPDWLTQTAIDRWYDSFFSAFETEYAAETGVPQDRFPRSRGNSYKVYKVGGFLEGGGLTFEDQCVLWLKKLF